MDQPIRVRRGTNPLLGLAGIVPAVVIILLLFAAPMAGLLTLSFQTGTGLSTTWSWETWQRFFADTFYLRIIWRTYWLAGLSTLLAAVIGYPLALVMARVSGRWRGLLIAMLITPLLTDVNVRALGQVILFGNQGTLNAILSVVGIKPLQIVGTELGVVLGMSQAYLPYMVLSLFAVLKGINRNMADAAATLGAGSARTYLYVTYPAGLPGLSSGSTLLLLLSASALVVPSIMGGAKVLTASRHIYQQALSVMDWAFAATMAGMLLIVTLFAVYLLAHLSTPLSLDRAQHGPIRRWLGQGLHNLSAISARVLPDLRRQRWLGTVVSVLILLYVLAPLITVLIGSFNSGNPLTFPPKGFTLASYSKLFHSPEYWQSAWTSTKIAFITTVLSVLVGLFGSLAAARQRLVPVERLMPLFLMPLTVPQIVTGLALLIFFQRLGVTMGTTTLILGHLLITLPYTGRIILATLANLDRTTEHAARNLGASPLRTLWHVTLPLLKPTLLVGSLFSFINSFSNVPVSVFVSGSGSLPLPVRIYSQLQAAMDLSAITALSVVLVCIAIVGVILIDKWVGLENFSLQ